ncbi:MAG: hypothetical protein ACI85F_002170 [Bacteroidia bacterium]|jgi:hypothetical protein
MKKYYLICLAISIGFSACKKDEEENGDPVTELNANLSLPAGSYMVDPDTMEIDNSVTIDGGSGGTMPINTGVQNTGQIQFSAPNGNVVGGGMRFGDSGPVNIVPVSGAMGQTSGTLSLPFSLSASTCDNLSQVCHDIKCYEFAVTADGKITQANIRDVALMCGACDEPSCASLIDPPCPPEPNTGTFNFSLGSGSGSAGCTGASAGIVANDWVVSILNSGTSGSITFTEDYYTQGCSSCSALQISDNQGNAYIAISGSGSWSGSTLNFSGTLKSLDDVINGGGSTYTLTGAVNCS